MDNFKVLFIALPAYSLPQLSVSDAARATYIVPPMGLFYLAEGIRGKEYIKEMKCLDFSLFSYSGVNTRLEYAAFIKSKLAAYQPDVAAIALTFSASYEFFELTAAAAKELWPHSVIIAGGIHATNTPDFILENTAVDYVICGEGEEVLAELLASLAQGLENAPHIPGLHFKGNLKYASEDTAEFEKAPFPASLNIDFTKYPEVFALDIYTQNEDSFDLAPKSAGDKYFPLMASRGCPVECVFCSAHTVHGRRPRWRDLANILAEINWLYQNYGVTKIHLLDDNFVPKKKAIELFTALGQIKIDGFEAVILNMNVNFTDTDIIDAIAAAKIKHITFAIESGSAQMQKKIRKNCDLEKARQLIGYCREKAIETRCFYMLGFPGETLAQMHETIEFALQAGADWSSFHIAVPLPGSKMYTEFSQQGYFQDGPAFWQNIDYKERAFDTPEITASDLKELMRFAELKLNFLNSPYLKKNDAESLLKAEKIFQDFLRAFEFHIFAYDCLRRVYKLKGDTAASQKILHQMKHLLQTRGEAQEFTRYLYLLEPEAQEFLLS